MPEKMNISVNGNSRVPPGFRFHPTEEELLEYYLRKKVGNETIDFDVISEVDLNKLEPWEIEEKCKIGSSTPQNEWYFFGHKDKKYPTGTRANRATTSGFWKATGRDKTIYSNTAGGSMNFSRQPIGLRKTLVFYKGRAPHGQKSDWIMYEYRHVDHDRHNYKYDDHHRPVNNMEMITTVQASNKASGAEMEDRWVVCKIFKKKNKKNNHTDATNTTQSNEENLLQHHPCGSPACNNEDALEYNFRDFEKTQEAEAQSATNMNNYLIDQSPNLTTQLPYNYNYQLHQLPYDDYQVHHDQHNVLPPLPPSINCSQLLTSVTENQPQLIAAGFPAQQQLISYDGIVNNLRVTAAADTTAIATIAGSSSSSTSIGPIGEWPDFDMLVTSHLNGPTMSLSQHTYHDHGRPFHQDS